MIIFTKDIPENILLTAYNNHVVKFSSESDLTPLYSEISGLGIFAKIYPSPDNSFRIDFKDHVASVVNTKKFADNLQTNLISGVSDSFTYNAVNGTYLEGVLTFTITFVDLTTETITRSVEFYTGVYQLEAYKKQEISTSSKYTVLSPISKRSDNSVDLKFWAGYPFEFSFYTSLPDSVFTLVNTSIGEGYDFKAKGRITSLWVSDGRTDISVEDFLPLSYGLNVLNIYAGDENQNMNINLNKVDSDCGIYVKWYNNQGRWTYWLLNKIHQRDLASKYNAELNNDFENIEDTISPTIQSGKVSNEILRCNVKNLTETERDVFIGIFTSPKIYYFTGERFSRSSFNDWIEVSLKNTNTKTSDTNRRKYNFPIDLELPTQNAQVQ